MNTRPDGSRPEPEMWAEAMEHVHHSFGGKPDCEVCHGADGWLPDDLNERLNAIFRDQHTGADDCPCLFCRSARMARAQAAATSPWCGTCNPDIRHEIAGSPGYREWFERQLREGNDFDGYSMPVPEAIDPTIKP